MSNHHERPVFEAGDRFRIMPKREVTIFYAASDGSYDIWYRKLPGLIRPTGTVLRKDIITSEFLREHYDQLGIEPVCDLIFYLVHLEGLPEEAVAIPFLEGVAAKAIAYSGEKRA